MSRCLHDACAMKEKHSKIFEDYNTTFSQDLTQAWNAHILKWNKNHSIKPDPYEEPETRRFSTMFIRKSHILIVTIDTSMKAIRLRLALEDAQEIESGTTLAHEVTPSSFLYLGLELEELQ